MEAVRLWIILACKEQECTELYLVFRSQHGFPTVEPTDLRYATALAAAKITLGPRFKDFLFKLWLTSAWHDSNQYWS